MPDRPGRRWASICGAALFLMLTTAGARAAEPYVGLWANDPKDCASKTVPPLIEIQENGAYSADLFCTSATFTPQGDGWKVHLECSDPMAGPGDDSGDSFDYRFSVVDGKLHWDPDGPGTGSVLKRCPG